MGPDNTSGHGDASNPGDTSRAAAQTVADRVRRAQDSFSAGERKIAKALLGHYPAAGLESTSALAARAGASAPTVVRFVARLGFAGYRDFQAALRDEVQARRASPLTLPAMITDASDTSELMEVAADVGCAALKQTFAALPAEDFERATELLCDTSRRIVGFGGRFTSMLAEYLDLHLRLMRPDTLLHVRGPGRDEGLVADLGPRDVCVVFDLRRYQRGTVELARFAHGRGATVVLVTDPWLSPVAQFADIVLPARVEAPSPFDSLVAPLALTEALVAAVQARLGPAAARRMRAVDDALADLEPGPGPDLA
ncbi:MurR/RpiR family transcriptional regulator [Streptomyces antnestii]|uniref:MurR/RpiR family transcriptional regulator n=1 Tax=Streptomyces antnestii TaxID=2494256 RepID=A0A437PCT1_9ACTN|nr:MurR/RpiR family transcriptional regulator [Streptomyces sp. San01]